MTVTRSELIERIADVRHQSEDLQGVDDACDPGVHIGCAAGVIGEIEGEHRRDSARQVALGEAVPAVARDTRVVDGGDLRMLRQVLREGERRRGLP